MTSSYAPTVSAYQQRKRISGSDATKCVMLAKKWLTLRTVVQMKDSVNV